MNRIEVALQRFSQGYNCAQSVFTTFATEYGLDLKIASQIAVPFGGGIVRSGELCGALSGGLMTLGLYLATFEPTDSDSKDRFYQLGQHFIERFREHFGETHCRNLIQRDLHTPSLHRAAKESGVFQSQCPQYVAFAVETLEAILKSSERKGEP